MADAILTLNAGSSSLKVALYRREAGGLAPHAAGQVEGLGGAPHLVLRDAAGGVVAERRWEAAGAPDYQALLRALLDAIDPLLGGDRLAAVGHRVVHGGESFVEPVRVTPAVLRGLEALVPLAPLHEPHNLDGIRALAAIRPGLAQFACFDTAFHHALPPLAARVPIPREYAAAGIRRYGFHGLSYEYLAGRLRECAPDLAGGRVVVAHLGNGASLCALSDGRSVDTTMGFSALDGLVMGTRSGSIDPGVLLYLLQQRGMSPRELEQMLYKRSGLLGVSGLSSDMRVLAASDDPRAKEAVALFCHRAARHTAGLVVALGGLDGIVFSAGIGEHAPVVRAGICAHLDWLGVRMDGARNEAGAARFDTPNSRVQLWMLPTDEESVIARHTARLLDAATGQEGSTA